PGRRAVHHRLPQAGGVLRLPRHGPPHAGRVLLEDAAVHELDDRAGRRPAVQPVRQDAEVGPGEGEAEPREGRTAAALRKRAPAGGPPPVNGGGGRASPRAGGLGAEPPLGGGGGQTPPSPPAISRLSRLTPRRRRS